MHAEIRYGWLQAINRQGSAGLAKLGPIAVVVVAAFAGTAHVGTLISLYLLAQRAFWGFDGIVDLSLATQSVRGAVNRCFEYIDNPGREPHLSRRRMIPPEGTRHSPPRPPPHPDSRKACPPKSAGARMGVAHPDRQTPLHRTAQRPPVLSIRASAGWPTDAPLPVARTRRAAPRPRAGSRRDPLGGVESTATARSPCPS